MKNMRIRHSRIVSPTRHGKAINMHLFVPHPVPWKQKAKSKGLLDRNHSLCECLNTKRLVIWTREKTGASSVMVHSVNFFIYVQKRCIAPGTHNHVMISLKAATNSVES